LDYETRSSVHRFHRRTNSGQRFFFGGIAAIAAAHEIRIGTNRMFIRASPATTMDRHESIRLEWRILLFDESNK
jgi:hypothetical protein